MKVSSPQIFLAAVLALTLTACGSSPLEAVSDFNREFDFSKVHNIAIQPIDRTNLNSIRISDMQVDRINEALASDLRRKGLTMVSDNKQADLLLTWHLITQEKTDVRSYNSMSYYNCWRCGPAVSDISVHQYTEGTFIVDMIDPMRGQSVWRSTIHSRLKSNPKPEGAEERRREAVMAIFSQFPPM